MADGMKLVMLCCVLHGGSAATVRADMADPTQPPPGYSSRELADPTIPAPVVPALRVESLFLMGDKPYALVDGIIVRPGDPLADGRIARIDAAGVWLRVPGARRNRLLKWLPDVVKTPLPAPAEMSRHAPQAPLRKEMK
jgi:hypothetical protein